MFAKQINYLPSKSTVWRIRKCLPNRLNFFLNGPNCLTDLKVFVKQKHCLPNRLKQTKSVCQTK